MSLETYKNTMKLTYWLARESRWGQIRIGTNASCNHAGSVPESKDNRCNASVHRHGGVCVVGMLRSGLETSREIHVRAEEWECSEATGVTSVKSEGILAYGEVWNVRQAYTLRRSP